jgi:hypothetical protein
VGKYRLAGAAGSRADAIWTATNRSSAIFLREKTVGAMEAPGPSGAEIQAAVLLTVLYAVVVVVPVGLLTQQAAGAVLRQSAQPVCCAALSSG